MVWVRQRTACNMHVHMCTCLCMCRCCKGDKQRTYRFGTYAPESVDSEPFARSSKMKEDETKEGQRSFLNPPLLLALGDFFGVDSARAGRSSAQMSHAHPSGWHRERYDRLRVPPSGDAHSLADVVRGLGATSPCSQLLHQAWGRGGWMGRGVTPAR